MMISEKTTVTQQTLPETRIQDVADYGSAVLNRIDPSAANDVDGWLQAFIDASAEVLADIGDDWDREKQVLRAEHARQLADLEGRLCRMEGQLEALMRLFGDAAQGRAKRKILTE